MGQRGTKAKELPNTGSRRNKGQKNSQGARTTAAVDVSADFEVLLDKCLLGVVPASDVQKTFHHLAGVRRESIQFLQWCWVGCGGVGWVVVVLGGLWWCWVGCGGVGWVVVVLGGLWWCWVGCGGVGWFVVVLGGLWLFWGYCGDIGWVWWCLREAIVEMGIFGGF